MLSQLKTQIPLVSLSIRRLSKIKVNLAACKDEDGHKQQTAAGTFDFVLLVGVP